jgi:hypothetical protein
VRRARLAVLVAVLGTLAACAGGREAVDRLATELYRERTPPPPLPPGRFVSDGCSCWPDGEWLPCCVAHDLAYWRGGTRRERLAADQAMKACVARQGRAVLSHIMYVGVRLGGVWWLPTPFRWGFGWPYPESGPPSVAY